MYFQINFGEIERSGEFWWFWEMAAAEGRRWLSVIIVIKNNKCSLQEPFSINYNFLLFFLRFHIKLLFGEKNK